MEYDRYKARVNQRGGIRRGIQAVEKLTEGNEKESKVV